MESDSTATLVPQAAHEELQTGGQPLTPDVDPFYRPPDGYEMAQPGTVLRSRDVELGFLGVVRQPVTATQLLYRSTNLHGEPEVAVTTVLVPRKTDPPAGLPGVVVSMCHRRRVAAVLPRPMRCGVRHGRSAHLCSPSSCWSQPHWRKVGRCRYPTMRAATACGGPRLNPATGSSTVCARPCSVSAWACPTCSRWACGVIRAVEFAYRLGRRADRGLRTRTQRGRRRARLTGR